MGEPARKPENGYPYDPKTGLFGCPDPDCEYTHKTQGAVQLHFYKKHGTRPADQQPRRSSTPPKRQRSEPNPEAEPEESVCRHQWRLLRDRNTLERAAREAGYREVCMTCEEVR